MAQIEIDFEVWKALTLRRETETTSMNDVLRELLKLPGQSGEQAPPPASGGCSYKGVELPEGTQFRANYKGQVVTGEIKNGAWVDARGTHTSPSAAAHAVTGSGINGWWFWQCKRPTDLEWAPLDHIRNPPKAA
jgi:hypothetical protein